MQQLFCCLINLWFGTINHVMLVFGQWTEVESLIKELKKIEGVQSVSKGRLFRSPGLAPTFQVQIRISNTLHNIMNHTWICILLFT